VITIARESIPRINVVSRSAGSHARAVSDLVGALERLGWSVSTGGAAAGADTLGIELTTSETLTGESFELRYDSERRTLSIYGAGDVAVRYGVFAFLEHQGVHFGLGGPQFPIDRAAGLRLPASPEHQSPVYPTRGLQPWPDFLNCVSVYDDADWRAYIDAMSSMRMNTLCMHSYAQAKKWVEPYAFAEYTNVGHSAVADNTSTDRWGYLPQRTSTYGMGGDQYYAGEVFGASASINARNGWEAAAESQSMLRTAFAYAASVGIKTGLGFEVGQVPDEILRACSPRVRKQLPPPSDGVFGGARGAYRPFIDPSSNTAKYVLEARLDALLDSQPSLSYVQLWEDEGRNWAAKIDPSVGGSSVLPFQQAHEFLARHAPQVRLVVAGWGGVVRNFDDFHRELPEDVIFAALNDSFGWEPVDEAFGRLGDRERWPIPWIEDDPAMWLPQLHVHRTARQTAQSVDLGCTGMLGIHWRDRLFDPTAGYLARRLWEPGYRPVDHYQAYATTLIGTEHADRLAHWFDDADRDQLLLNSDSGERDDAGRVVGRHITPDYWEAFNPEPATALDPETVSAHYEMDQRLTAIADDVPAGEAADRLRHWTGHLTFTTRYLEAWQAGATLHGLLDRAFEEADSLVEETTDEAFAEWVKVLAACRAAVVALEGSVATRSDLGTLASVQNKFVRLAAHRTREEFRELLDTLPADVDAAYRAAIASWSEPQPRVVLMPALTSVTRGRSELLTILCPGPDAPDVVRISQRRHGSVDWSTDTAALRARRTFGYLIDIHDEDVSGVDLVVESIRGGAPMAAAPTLTVTVHDPSPLDRRATT